MNLDILYADAIAGDADARAKLLMHADILNEFGETILHVEAKNGNAERVKFILRQFPNPNLLVRLSYLKKTALHWAVHRRHTEVVEVLIEAARHLPSSSANDDTHDNPVTSFQAFLRQRDENGDTALHLAVHRRHTEVVEVLIEAARHLPSSSANDDTLDNPVTSFQAFLRQGDEDGDTALHLAVKEGHVAIVKLLVEADSTDTNIQNYEGKTPMYIAVEKGFHKIVEIISTTCTAPTLPALHLAARYGHTEVVKVLIEAAGHLPSSSANDDNPVNSFQAFLRQRDENGDSSLHLAAYRGHTEVVKVLIEAARHLPSSANQAFLRQSNRNMDTALHLAVMDGNVDIVKLLVKADPTERHSQNTKGKTPMYIAVEEGFNDIVEIIYTTCTDPSLDGPGGATILHTASKNGNAERVRFILREFAHKNLLTKLTKYKRTALHWATHNGDTEVAEVLIHAARDLPPSSANDPVTSFQAFLRQGDKDMKTALHAAVMKGNVAIVKLLVHAARDLPPSPATSFLRQGAEDGNTALHFAAEKGHVDIVKLLVDAEPHDRHIKNSYGRTPIYIAAEKGFNDIVEIICTTCTAPSLDGPAKQIDEDVIRMIINAAKRSSTPPTDAPHESFEAFFNKTDGSGCTVVLEQAVMENHVNMVELILVIDLILLQDPASQHGRPNRKYCCLMSLIYKASDKEYEDVVELLSRNYETGGYKGAVALILAIRKRDKDSVLRLLDDDKHLATFVEDKGWTPLHYAAFHEFDSVLDAIIEAQKDLGYQFIYKDMVQTPILVAAEKGYTSTVIRLMELWPTSSSAYTAINNDGRNILHLAAAENKKEMIQGILKYCPEKYKDKILKQQNVNGDTPLHLLISHGCFIPELIKHRGLDTMVRNKRNWTPWDMLYSTDDIIADQVQIKIALDHIVVDQKRDIFSSSVLSISKRERKDAIFNERAKLMILEKHAQMKENTDAVANCFADAIAGDPISKAALEMEADTVDAEGKTILHIESMRGNTERVEYIVREFAKKSLLMKLDTLKQTALHLAANHGRTQVVKVLIDAARHLPSFKDFMTQANGRMGNTALHLAVLNGDVAIVKLIVDADPNDSHVQNNEGKTPIYIAAENGYKDMVKEICTTCTALSLDGAGGRTTALHALVQSITGVSDVIRIMVNAAKRWSTSADFEALFSRTDESESTVLQLAVEKNNVDAVRLILEEDPAYQQGGEIKRNGLMRLIYKAIDKNCSDDIIKVLSQTYEAGIIKGVLSLILAIRSRDEDSVLRLLGGAKDLVTFTEDNGWTPLHYAVYHEFDSVLGAIIGAQEDVEHQFVYRNMVPTPFHLAVKSGHASTLVLLMQLWPASSSELIDANSPYTAIDENGRNILHLAALAATDNKKEMVQGILRYCPDKCKDKILKQQDINGDTPLHLLIAHGCFIPELIKHKGLDTMAKNKNKFTPRDMLYFKNEIVADQVHIKIALDDVQTNQSAAWNLWAKSTEEETNIWKSIVPPSKRRIKDVIFDEGKKLVMNAKYEQMKKDLERYKMRTNTQIIVAALITTVTFTVGFTMPGGLRQSGEVDEGSVILTRKAVFNAFMVSDALALLLSTCSLFLYFLESMYEDPHQVSKLNAASVGLNIVSIMAMMLTFITGTYLVLSHSPALAITVCLIGSFFFIFVIVLLIKFVSDHQVKRNED